MEIRVQGKTTSVPAAHLDGGTVITTGKWLRIAGLQDEELLEAGRLADPSSFAFRLKATGLKADIFTFAQRLPDTTPHFAYHREWDNFAVAPITTFSDWWENRVQPTVRTAVRKAAKAGVVVSLAELDETFAQGIVNINNEAPVRQGKPFWHFQKSLEAVLLESSTYPERTAFLGAYLGHELIGYIRLTYAGKVAHIIQLLSMMKHFDKRPANALVAKAVEICAEQGISHLVYRNYVYNDPNSSLTEFKRRSGFEKILLPRYFIPLTLRGSTALRLGLHRGVAHYLPKPLLGRLLKLRSLWYTRKATKAN